MKNEEIVYLPVSIGEALDKLTILEIKLEEIKDERADDVKKEYDLLYAKLEQYVIKNQFHYKLLKKINQDIWKKQDYIRYWTLRTGPDRLPCAERGPNSMNVESETGPSQRESLCQSIIEENDRRFRIKKKINRNSTFKEQKGYILTKAFVLTHLDLGDNISSIGLVRYLSTCFDQIIVVCKCENYENLELIYQDDPDIQLYSVNSDHDISVSFGCDIHLFQKITEGCKVITTGYHNDTLFDVNCSPLSFYKQIDLGDDIFWDYFHIPEKKEYVELYNHVKDIDYAFIHDQSSCGLNFSIDDIEKKMQINRDQILFINPNYNCYDCKHPFYELANKFIKYPLPYYMEIIKKSNYNIVCDSSFFCMAINLEIQHDNNYLYSDNDYDFLFENAIPNKKKFINLNCQNKNE